MWRGVGGVGLHASYPAAFQNVPPGLDSHRTEGDSGRSEWDARVRALLGPPSACSVLQVRLVSVNYTYEGHPEAIQHKCLCFSCCIRGGILSGRPSCT